MTKTKGNKNRLIELPEEYKNMNYIAIDEVCEDYILFEDGRLYSKKTGKFRIPKQTHKDILAYTIINNEGRTTSLSKDCLVRKYFNHDLDNIEHKEMFGNEKYVVTKDGRIYSLIQNMFITPKRTTTGWLNVCLMFGKERRTVYIAKAVWEAFNGPITKDYKIIFKDNNKANCSLENLDIELKGVYKNKQIQDVKNEKSKRNNETN